MKKLLKFEAIGQEFAKILRSIKQFIRTMNDIFLQNAVLTCSWRVLRSNTLEQLFLTVGMSVFYQQKFMLHISLLGSIHI